MKPVDFVAKYSQVQQKESDVAQSHVNDMCPLVDLSPTQMTFKKGQRVREGKN